MELAGLIARDRARVVAVGAVGLQIPRKTYYEKELTFLNSRSYGPGRYDRSYEEGGRDYPIGYVRWTERRNLEAVVDLLASGSLDVKSLITHRVPIQQAPEAYRLIQGQTGGNFKGVLLTYPSTTGEQSFDGNQPPNRQVDVLSDPALARVELKAGRGQPRSASQPGTLQVGVLGAGNFASAVLLPAIQKVPGVRLVGVVSASGVSAQRLPDRRAAAGTERRVATAAPLHAA